MEEMISLGSNPATQGKQPRKIFCVTSCAWKETSGKLPPSRFIENTPKDALPDRACTAHSVVTCEYACRRTTQ